MLARKPMWAVFTPDAKLSGDAQIGQSPTIMPRSVHGGNGGVKRGVLSWLHWGAQPRYSYGSMRSSMKEKTSITLSKEVLADVDQLAGRRLSRSAFIESVLRGYIQERRRAQAHAQDVERINSAAAQLNSEAADVWEYQAPDD